MANSQPFRSTSIVESLFVSISEITANVLPKGELSNLLVNGIIAGLSGVVVFVK